MAARAGWPNSSAAGQPELRHRLVQRLRLRTGTQWTPDQVLVTAGASQALSLIFSTFLRPGNEVLLPNPGWPKYQALVLRRCAVPVAYDVSPRREFLPSIDEISRLITPRTRMLVINSPSNPTGAVYPRALMQELVELTERRGILLISDEAYDEMVFDGVATGACGLGGQRTISVHSFSKTYAMSDWRVGYLVGHSRVVCSLAEAQETDLSRVSPIAQAAAMAALTGPQTYPGRIRETLRLRRDLVVDILTAAGLDVQTPASGFFVLVPLAPSVDSRAAARDLERFGVVVTPGSAFGTGLASHLRLSLTVGEMDLVVGTERLAEWALITGSGAGLGVMRRGAVARSTPAAG